MYSFTLDLRIDEPPRINIAPGKFGKKIGVSPSNKDTPSHLKWKLSIIYLAFLLKINERVFMQSFRS